MEEIIPKLTERLRSAIKVKKIEQDLKIVLVINSEFVSEDNFGSKEEVKEMLRNFGQEENDLNQIEISLIEDLKTIEISCNDKNSFDRLITLIERLPEDLESIMQKAWMGDNLSLKNINYE